MSDPAPSTWYPKRRYHHGNLRESALARGREVVASHGPTGLTLRGLARDLGVSATALVRYFGSISGLRSAVAESALENLAEAARSGARRSPREVGQAWIEFAAANPNLYRLACGEAWHTRVLHPNGYLGALAVPSPRRVLESMLRSQQPSYERKAKPMGYLAFTIHGLALARMDGVPETDIQRGLERALA